MLGNGVGRVGRDSHDGHAQVVRRDQIDVVEAGAAQGDEPGAARRQGGECVGIEWSLTKTQTAGKLAASATVAAVRRGSTKARSWPWAALAVGPAGGAALEVVRRPAARRVACLGGW